ncbi:ABC transporter permease [Levilactobacillus brevis]|uniref:ABC transporter permease n=1 Tax=Levilactobacillus brevis TaxID=1580 RepID=UPI001C1E9A0B|nr:ABC transporter permease [Levilactobacillus brevis]MBU7559304.1 ABC transporter permease [Levilactobacillus brevis]MCE6010901.1 ABC transporter permease [Levilactobacillus brevis]MCE6013170.1 ABC transporter permease [Levilactobacillus brevis]MCE6015517.1 ABC transporter permease [Levilactobacillus brevis]MCE6017987.1 ABC transporter permease [Levilactobacillus brevis]
MLAKLALAGIKNRRRDYLVLLAGLTMSAAIFYMFANLATNKAFISANAVVSQAVIIFGFGAVLLILISLVYIMYANSFLLSMRQHDYGVFMMLGAKRRRIGQLVFLETLILGTIATAIGIGLGLAMSKFLVGFLLNLLGLHLAHLQAVYVPAIIATAVLYVGLFVLASLFNLLHLTRSTVLKLLHSDDQADQPKVNPGKQIGQALLGIVLLAIGYWALAAIKLLQVMAIPIALVTITCGTYLLFRATLLVVIRALRHTSWAKKHLSGFLLGQLNFRVYNYTRMLTIVSLLFAMALGAITVGSGYHRQLPQMAGSFDAYTLAVHNVTPKQQKLINQLHVSHQATYTQKRQGKVVYYNATELRQQPFEQLRTTGKSLGKNQYYTESLSAFQKKGLAGMDFQNLAIRGAYTFYTPKILKAQQFSRQAGKAMTVTTLRVKNMQQDQRVLKQLNQSELDRYPLPTNMTVGSYQSFTMMNAFFGGLEFMGYFLGIAFLAMLASCLMFKILSGAPGDQRRYRMLYKVGVRQGLMRAGIAKEIGILFLIPGIMGIVDVLFGLQMFKPLMQAPMSPYLGIGSTFLIFIGLYAIYYVITLALYWRIVLPKQTD